MPSDLLTPAPVYGSYPLRDGNSVCPLIDGAPAFRRIREAVEAATTSIYATITFMWPSFRWPDDGALPLDIIEAAASRGVDVRLIFWRPDLGSPWRDRNTFWGSPSQFADLASRNSSLKIRWDQAATGFCQHQKTWLIDADTESEVAFVGGINLNPNSVVEPGHFGESQNHDVYLEISGPATVDVHHNFVQRWNEASERNFPNGIWGVGSEVDLQFPLSLPPERGEVQVQIQRTIHPGRYQDTTPAPKFRAHEISSGECSILDQYLSAIRSARRSIYIENQYLTVTEILSPLQQALERGVEVVALLPAQPDNISRYIGDEEPDFWELWQTVAQHPNFFLAGLAGLNSAGTRTPVYVHGKIMLIDDEWATVGSANLHRFSLFGSGELNASFWNHAAVKSFRCELFLEHLGRDTADMDDLPALRLYKSVAAANRVKWDAGDPNWDGLIFGLEAMSYGR